MRLRVYAGASVALGFAVLLRALHQRSNFYSACVFLAQSNANLMILMNLVLLCVGTILLGLQKLLYGPLRPIETEQLYEKAWFAVTETCLAMTIFRGEVGGWFIVMFVSLLIGKVWGWIGEGRVEILEQQPPANPRLFHARLSISLLLSLFFDYYMLDYCVGTVLRQARPDMMVMFGFEFAVLSITSTSTAARYAISLTELYIVNKQKKAKFEERRRELQEARETAIQQRAGTSSEGPLPEIPEEQDIEEMDLDVLGWEEKGRYIFYLDLMTDFLKLVVYLSFFFILLTFYGLPIHIMRDVFLTIRSFFKRIADFVRYRNATKDMNERYPDATAAEITREDTCIICREDMVAWETSAPGAEGENGGAPRRPASPMAERMRPKKLPCGHILHFACLRSWLERQQNCPTCRRPVLVTNRITVAPVNPQPLQDNNNHNNNNNAQGGAPQQPPQLLGANPAPAGNPVLPAGQNRARIFNFGPFRVGFGAGRGNLFQDLAQQVHGGGQPPIVPENQGGAQQIGFGFGFGQPQPQVNPTPAIQTGGTSIESQLQQLELQLVQQINHLRLTTDQLRVVRELQAQLTRLRMAQAANQAQPGTTPAANAAGNPTPRLGPHVRHGTDVLRGSHALNAGDPNLPQGLTLPEGWTLMPLQRMDGSAPGLPPPIATGSSSVVANLNAQNAATQAQSNSTSSQTPPSNAGQEAANAPETSVGGASASADASEPATLISDGVVPDLEPPFFPPDVAPQKGDSQISDLNSTGAAPTTSNPVQIGDDVLANGTPVSSMIDGLPNWGLMSTEVKGGGSQESRPHDEWVDVWKDKSALEPQASAHNEGGERSSAGPSQIQDKGKSRAATVEDFIDDVD